MRSDGLRARVVDRRRLGIRGRNPAVVTSNRLDRQFDHGVANQAWVTDITYIRTHEGWLYLAVVLDLFSKKIVGWAIRSTMHTEARAHRATSLRDTPGSELRCFQLHRDVLQHPSPVPTQRRTVSGRVRKAAIKMRLRGVYGSRGDSSAEAQLPVLFYRHEHLALQSVHKSAADPYILKGMCCQLSQQHICSGTLKFQQGVTWVGSRALRASRG